MQDQVDEMLAEIPLQQVLRAVADHQQLLEQVHVDAHRLAVAGVRQAYLVDFDLIYAFMWPDLIKDPARVAEATFLFEQDEIFILGPGTLRELEHSLHQMLGDDLYVFAKDGTGRPEDAINTYLAEMEDRLDRLLTSGNVQAVGRLNQLLRSEKFRVYSRMASVVDIKVYDEVFNYLKDKRRGYKRVPVNIADALNCGAVSHLRTAGRHLEVPIFPYLLTSTGLLQDLPPSVGIDEAAGEPRLARSARSAVYTTLLSSHYDARDAAQYDDRIKAFKLK